MHAPMGADFVFGRILGWAGKYAYCEGAALFSCDPEPTGNGRSSVAKAKPFNIPKRRRLKQDDQTKTIPIIAITALASPEDENKGLEGGCDAYAPKPINLGNLPRTIESFLKIRPATLATLASITPPGWV